MSYQEASGFCNVCDRIVMIRRKGTNHIFHLLLSVITYGIWIPIWILISIKIGGWRCIQCGSKANKSLFQ